MKRSEVLENYFKIATESGLIKPSSIEKSADYKDKTRYDSRSFSDIQALYGIDVGELEKNKSITEVAHPDTLVVSPSYDLLHGVVENDAQRQEFMRYVATKEPNGNIVQRRYIKASEDLLNTLVSIGFEMDSRDEEGLTAVADECASNLVSIGKKKHTISKEARRYRRYSPSSRSSGSSVGLLGGLGRLAVNPYAWAVAAVIGLGYLAYGSTSVQNVYANSNLVLDRVSEFSNAPFYKSIYSSVTKLRNLSGKFKEFQGKVVARSLDDAADKSVGKLADSRVPDVVALTKEYKDCLQETLSLCDKWVGAINLYIDAMDNGTDSDALAKIKWLFRTVTPDSLRSRFQDGGEADAQELIDEVIALKGAIIEAGKTLSSVEAMAESNEDKIIKRVDKNTSEEDVFTGEDPQNSSFYSSDMEEGPDNSADEKVVINDPIYA